VVVGSGLNGPNTDRPIRAGALWSIPAGVYRGHLVAPAGAKPAAPMYK
jgi:hypothetical protein